MMTYLHLCSRAALRRADLLLTVSEHARREIARRSGFDPHRIVAIPHAPAPGLCRVSDAATRSAVAEHHQIRRRFVLADALKNPGTLVRAWRMLPARLRASHQIVFFARRPDAPAIVIEAVERGEAQLLVQPSQADLIALYSMAEAFVFPSWIEGFGIPVLEAMTCGAPVIASDRGAIPEVAGGAALIADAEDAHAFAEHIARVLTDSRVAEELRQRGSARAAQFSWETTAGRILQTYEQVACYA
jgi:glycosyltransferase involved in cell wall biosynthesis